MIYDSVKDIPNLDWYQDMLARRGYEMVEDGEWEKHGLYHFNFMVLTGPCVKIGHHTQYILSIYPNHVYKVGAHSRWGDTRKENLIPVLERKK